MEMKIKYSSSAYGFYYKSIHGDNIPSDAVEITFEDYANLMQGQTSRKIISSDNSGYPILIDPEAVIYVPKVVSKAQGLLELHERGLLDDIEDYMQNQASVNEKIAWNNIQQFEYDSPMLNGLLGNFGLTEEDKDDLFISAASRTI